MKIWNILEFLFHHSIMHFSLRIKWWTDELLIIINLSGWHNARHEIGYHQVQIEVWSPIHFPSRLQFAGYGMHFCTPSIHYSTAIPSITSNYNRLKCQIDTYQFHPFSVYLTHICILSFTELKKNLLKIFKNNFSLIQFLKL